MSKLSVLISVYANNNSDFFHQAMDSIWTNQTVKPDKIILVEDGILSDELYKEISEWKHQLNDVLIVHKNRENQGLTKSLNTGIKYIATKYIARMDSDDISHPSRFESQLNFLNKNPNIAVLGGSIEEINEKGESLNVRSYPSNTNDAIKYIAKASPLAHPSVIMKKELFDAGFKYNESYRTSQDIALWFDVLSAGYEIANLKDVVLYFRITNNTFSRRSGKKAINEFIIYIRGIKKMFGLVSIKYIYPILRLTFRLMPNIIIKYIYKTNIIRNSILKN
jgi:glycosyltransferase involved in cell wall biosynthesis